MEQNKIAIINDFTGFGRCALTVQIPLISALKIQAVPIPTAILSCHMQFKHYYIDDYTTKMKDYIQTYKQNNLQFNGILTGYMSSIEQIDTTLNFIEQFHSEMILVDPVMGDHGKLYSTISSQMTEKMYELISKAHIITPNLTELCALTHTPYDSSHTIEEIINMCKTLIPLGIRHIIVTGIKLKENTISNLIYNHNHSYRIIEHTKIGKDRCGCGDVMSAIIAGTYLKTHDIFKSIDKAYQFTIKCIKRCEELEIPHHYGLCIEEYLTEL